MKLNEVKTRVKLGLNQVGVLGAPLSFSSTYKSCGKLGWEEQNCSPTASFTGRKTCPWLLIDHFRYLKIQFDNEA